MSSNSIRRGIHKGSLSAIVPVLNQWQSIVENTAKLWAKDGDATWWYNERASLSLFAGAIWKCKGFAFEEFSVERKIDTKRGSRRKNGRCDIEFELKRKYYIAEAKQCWPTLGQHKEDAVQKVSSSLEQAEIQVAQVWEKGYHSLAMAFVIPRIPIGYTDETESSLLGLASELGNLPKTTVAWVFPKATRQLRPPRTSPFYNLIYPGVILAITSCKR